METMSAERLGHLKLIAATPVPVPGRATEEYLRGACRWAPERIESEGDAEEKNQLWGNIANPMMRAYILWLEGERVKISGEAAALATVLSNDLQTNLDLIGEKKKVTDLSAKLTDARTQLNTIKQNNTDLACEKKRTEKLSTELESVKKKLVRSLDELENEREFRQDICDGLRSLETDHQNASRAFLLRAIKDDGKVRVPKCSVE